MSARDPETGQFVSDDGTDMDYSDFEYETFSIEHAGNGDPNLNVARAFQWEPLQQIGGLDVNEVAELVYMEISAAIEYEDEDGDQNLASDAELRGVIGANLDGVNDLHAHSNSRLQVVDEDEVNGTLAGQGGLSDLKNESRIFAPFNAYGSAPATSAANGAGSNGASTVIQTNRNWRGLTGRGPVLDSSDDMSVVARLISGQTADISVVGSIRGHLVYDTAEVDDAGRAFSVPMDD